MPNYNYLTIKGNYGANWDEMVIDPSREPAIKAAAEKIIQGKPRYEKLQNETKVPWYFIGILHYRESDCNFNTHLHNGDSLARRTVHVPAGRPRIARPGEPPFDFDYSAQDALKLQGFTGQTDWSIERIAYRGEAFNGWGYRMHHIPSPYLWSGSGEYKRGKYVSDGVFDSSVVDHQMGIMPILKEISKLDPTVILTHDGAQVPVGVTTTPVVSMPPVLDSPKADIPRPSTSEMSKTSRKFFLHNAMQKLAGFLGLGTLTAGGLDQANLQQTQGALDVIKGFVASYGLWTLGCICVIFVVFCGVNMYLMKSDVQEARATPSGAVTTP